jgi:hypothetical protein
MNEAGSTFLAATQQVGVVHLNKMKFLLDPARFGIEV